MPRKRVNVTLIEGGQRYVMPMDRIWNETSERVRRQRIDRAFGVPNHERVEFSSRTGTVQVKSPG